MAKKISKKGLGKRITGSLISAGTGAAVNVAEAAIGGGDAMNYIMLGIGAALPAFVPGNITEKLGDSMTAIAGYKIAQGLNLAGAVGLEQTPSTTGLGDRSMIGQAKFRTVADIKRNKEKRVKAGNFKDSPMGV